MQGCLSKHWWLCAEKDFVIFFTLCLSKKVSTGVNRFHSSTCSELLLNNLQFLIFNIDLNYGSKLCFIFEDIFSIKLAVIALFVHSTVKNFTVNFFVVLMDKFFPCNSITNEANRLATQFLFSNIVFSFLSFISRKTRARIIHLWSSEGGV